MDIIIAMTAGIIIGMDIVAGITITDIMMDIVMDIMDITMVITTTGIMMDIAMAIMDIMMGIGAIIVDAAAMVMATDTTIFTARFISTTRL
jgi:hypothetical protein